MTRPPVRRLVALLVVMIVALVGVVVRMAVLQVRRSDSFSAMGVDQRNRTSELRALRGDILDRNGVPLAMTLEARDVYANPRSVTDPVMQAARIAPILELKVSDVRTALAGSETFVYLARHVDLEVAERLEQLHLPGIGFLPSLTRYYPAGALAPQVLGFVGVDGVGLAGLEQRYETLLAGRSGQRTVEVSAQGQEIAGGMEVASQPVPGSDLVLSIDRELQFRTQEYLKAAVKQNGAKGGSVIVLDPRSGDVLAMATYPWFDPNAFEDSPPEARSNRAVTDAWEPGSVNKIITAAAALETDAVTLTQRFTVPGTREIEGFTIHDAHPHGPESMTLGDIIVESSNVGSSLVADEVGNEAMAAYFGRFGFGHPSGVGFPGEAAGLMPTLTEWSGLTRATVSFGAGVAVTPLQMASVYATIANGGRWVQPRLVSGTVGTDGATRPVEASPTRQVLRPATARTLTQMLAMVVEEGTGGAAQIPGYQVAGKTGTAKKLDAQGRYVNRYVASFMGFLPASAPRVVVAAILDEPRTVYGGVAAAPLFQNVARFAIQRLGIEPAPAVQLPAYAISRP
ncbi:MAG: peptidoglycan D,D-transpeptidase FtsI family protein [Actinomycetota bacterium]